MDSVLYIILAVLAIAVLILAAAFFTVSKKVKDLTSSDLSKELQVKIDGMQKNVGDEFSRVRMETQSNNNKTREEMQKSLENMSERIDRMNRTNNEALISIRDKSIEQSEKQNKTIELPENMCCGRFQ